MQFGTSSAPISPTLCATTAQIVWLSMARRLWPDLVVHLGDSAQGADKRRLSFRERRDGRDHAEREVFALARDRHDADEAFARRVLHPARQPSLSMADGMPAWASALSMSCWT